MLLKQPEHAGSSRLNVISEHCKNVLVDSGTHATIEPCDEGSGFRVIARGKEPEPVVQC